MEDVPFTLKVRMLRAEVIKTLGREHFTELRATNHKVVRRIIGSQRQQRTDHLMPYAKALGRAQFESVETAILKRSLLFAGPYSGRLMSG